MSGTIISQNISFKQYINLYKKAKLPFTITQKKVEDRNKDPKNFMEDSIVSKFLELDLKVLTAKEGPHSYFQYYACPIKNDSMIAVVYLRLVPVQCELYHLEIALYNTKTKKLIDKMHISTYNVSIAKQGSLSDDGTWGFGGPTVVDFYPAEIDKSLVVTTTGGVFQTTLSGFKVVSGHKEEATEW